MSVPDAGSKQLKQIWVTGYSIATRIRPLNQAQTLPGSSRTISEHNRSSMTSSGSSSDTSFQPQRRILQRWSNKRINTKTKREPHNHDYPQIRTIIIYRYEGRTYIMDTSL
jgi:hypothetical protein